MVVFRLLRIRFTKMSYRSILALKIVSKGKNYIIIEPI